MSNSVKVTRGLLHLAQEASEVIKDSTKALLFGMESFNPANPAINNKQLIENEAADMLACLNILNDLGAIDMERILALVPTAQTKKQMAIFEF